MKKIWNFISSVGITPVMSDFERKSVAFINRICAVLCTFVFTSILINLILRSSIFVPALSVSLGFFLLTYFFNYKGHFTAGKLSTLLTVLILLNFMCFKAGFGSGLELYFLSLTVLPFIIFRDNRIIFSFQILNILCLIAQKFYAPVSYTDAIEYKVFYVVNSVYSSLFIILAVLFFRNLNRENEKQLYDKARVINYKNAELELINKELDAFTYSVSHDLHAPLRTIDGFAKLLERKYKDSLDEEGKDLLQRIHGGTVKMRTLIDELLQLSQTGLAELKPTAINMEELVRNSISELKDEINANAEIIIKPLPMVFADQTLIFQVMTNLISNALKYSSKKEKPLIEIGSLKETKADIFYVKDNGAGFDMKYSDKLFKVFQRLHNANDFEGTGVGLAIIQSIISKHQGKVWAESEPGNGAVFYFSLPRLNP